jgi:hypothetical protein
VTAWRDFYRHWAATEVDRPPVTVTHTVPPADIVPPEEIAELETEARMRHVARVVHRTLVAESLKDPGRRNADVIDLCLHLRTVLQPPPPDPQELREVPPVGIRYPVPVIPGGAS